MEKKLNMDEYWLLIDVIRKEGDCCPVGEIMLRGSYEEALLMAQQYNFESFNLVKMELVNERFVNNSKYMIKLVEEIFKKWNLDVMHCEEDNLLIYNEIFRKLLR
jgi:hypothetical protein